MVARPALGVGAAVADGAGVDALALVAGPVTGAVYVGPARLLARQALADLVAVAVGVAPADGAAGRPLAQLVCPAVRVHRAHRHAELAVALEVNNSGDYYEISSDIPQLRQIHATYGLNY